MVLRRTGSATHTGCGFDRHRGLADVRRDGRAARVLRDRNVQRELCDVVVGIGSAMATECRSAASHRRFSGSKSEHARQRRHRRLRRRFSPERADRPSGPLVERRWHHLEYGRPVVKSVRGCGQRRDLLDSPAHPGSRCRRGHQLRLRMGSRLMDISERRQLESALYRFSCSLVSVTVSSRPLGRHDCV